MVDDDNRGKNRAAQMRELIGQLKGRTASPDTPRPADPRKESLREAVHRRARELRAIRRETQEKPPSSDGTT
ncbi:hypothetical protein [Streptomyces sp. NPDC006335]|uniref:hypothetical protein n=1 Tax=Streptomyces sp. NPDC006335 TaxID=3156895 RepID=UPI0033B710D5